jgi:hypothetical protein
MKCYIIELWEIDMEDSFIEEMCLIPGRDVFDTGQRCV